MSVSFDATNISQFDLKKSFIDLNESVKAREPVPNHVIDSKIYARINSNSVVQSQPTEVLFSGFVLNKTNTSKIKFTNISSELAHFHIIPPQTKYFTIRYVKPDRLVPGFSVECVVEFVPDEMRYFYDAIRIHSKDEDNNLVIPIHAYPVVGSQLKFPAQFKFNNVPVGHTEIKHIDLTSSASVDFEFELIVLQDHSALEISPMAGVIPAKSTLRLQVVFSPYDFVTAIKILELHISQFKFKPMRCNIMGYSEPGLKRKLVRDEFSVDSNDAAYLGQSSLLDPASIRPLNRTKSRKLKSQKQKPGKTNDAEADEDDGCDGSFYVKDGYRIPLELNTPYAIAYVLNQKPGQLKMKDLQKIIDEKSSGDEKSKIESSRQLKETIFDQEVRKNVYEERQNQLRWQKKIGDSVMTAVERESVLLLRKHAWNFYKSKRGDPDILEEINRVGSAQGAHILTHQRRTLRFLDVTMTSNEKENCVEWSDSSSSCCETFLHKQLLQRDSDGRMFVVAAETPLRMATDIDDVTEKDVITADADEDKTTKMSVTDSKSAVIKFDAYSNDQWMSRKYFLEKFQQAAYRLIVKHRLENRLKVIRLLKRQVERIEQIPAAEKRTASAYTAYISPEGHVDRSRTVDVEANPILRVFSDHNIIGSVTFPTADAPGWDLKLATTDEAVSGSGSNVTDASTGGDESAPTDRAEAAASQTDTSDTANQSAFPAFRTTRHYAYFPLITGRQWQLDGCERVNVQEFAQTFYAPIDVFHSFTSDGSASGSGSSGSRKFRTGAEDEIITVTNPDTAQTALTILESVTTPLQAAPDANVARATKNDSQQSANGAIPPLTIPRCLYQSVSYPKMFVFNASPGVMLYEQMLAFDETDQDFRLCPLPRYFFESETANLQRSSTENRTEMNVFMPTHVNYSSANHLPVQSIANSNKSVSLAGTAENALIRGARAWHRFPSSAAGLPLNLSPANLTNISNNHHYTSPTSTGAAGGAGGATSGSAAAGATSNTQPVTTWRPRLSANPFCTQYYPDPTKLTEEFQQNEGGNIAEKSEASINSKRHLSKNNSSEKSEDLIKAATFELLPSGAPRMQSELSVKDLKNISTDICTAIKHAEGDKGEQESTNSKITEKTIIDNEDPELTQSMIDDEFGILVAMRRRTQKELEEFENEDVKSAVKSLFALSSNASRGGAGASRQPLSQTTEKSSGKSPTRTKDDKAMTTSGYTSSAVVNSAHLEPSGSRWIKEFDLNVALLRNSKHLETRISNRDADLKAKYFK